MQVFLEDALSGEAIDGRVSLHSIAAGAIVDGNGVALEYTDTVDGVARLPCFEGPVELRVEVPGYPTVRTQFEVAGAFVTRLVALEAHPRLEVTLSDAVRGMAGSARIEVRCSHASGSWVGHEVAARRAIVPTGASSPDAVFDVEGSGPIRVELDVPELGLSYDAVTREFAPGEVVTVELGLAPSPAP